ncbi:hypothetical protein [Streptomyces sp. PTY087I2]|uniref:hypothetical protein n=1 Tax=Streptomyces sp. PTY087I2 TaxID=1819298 RepID=UPI000828BF3A|nr:hypothetical protein [Streptomyces sp. PTY087I2]OCC13993.1 hypothetical protein A3Q37_00266 [Streptomyces sp. PTY087I2]
MTAERFTGRHSRRTFPPDVAVELGVQDPQEAARSQALQARISKAAATTGHMMIDSQDAGTSQPPVRSPQERAAILISVLSHIDGMQLTMSVNPTAIHAEAALRDELGAVEHGQILRALDLADEFGHSTTRARGETVWASYRTRTGPAEAACPDGDPRQRRDTARPGSGTESSSDGADFIRTGFGHRHHLKVSETASPRASKGTPQ